MSGFKSRSSKTRWPAPGRQNKSDKVMEHQQDAPVTFRLLSTKTLIHKALERLLWLWSILMLSTSFEVPCQNPRKSTRSHLIQASQWHSQPSPVDWYSHSDLWKRRWAWHNPPSLVILLFYCEVWCEDGYSIGGSLGNCFMKLMQCTWSCLPKLGYPVFTNDTNEQLALCLLGWSSKWCMRRIREEYGG